MKIDLSCPVQLKSLVLKNEEKTVEATFFNISQKTIKAMKYTLVLFDENKNEISKISDSFENISFGPRESFLAVLNAEGGESANIIPCEFTFEDDSVFVPSGEMTEIEIVNLTDDEKARFFRAGVSDAICYAKEDESYWLCVCGRPNHIASDRCVICEREKEEVLKNYISEQSVASAILKKEELAIIEKQKQEELLKEQKALKKAELIKKAKKLSIFSGIVALGIIVLLLCLKLILTVVGNSYASNGDYAKAAKMYQLAASSKFDDVADDLYGSSATNLVYMGIMAEDRENIYYVDESFGLHRQNKETGKKTAFEGLAGRSLNASGGYLYYLGVNDNLIYRVTKDGASVEQVYSEPAYYFYTVGNDVYFIADKYTDQENQQMLDENPYALYVLKDGSKEPKLISTNNIGAFDIYKDKIYYMDFSDNYNLYSMSLTGKNAKKIIEASINSFEVTDGKIYYTDTTVPEDSQTGMPPLALEVASLNGKHKETAIEDAMVSMFAIAKDKIYYTDYNSQGVLYKFEKGQEPLISANNVSMFNASGDFIYYLSSQDGGLFLTKHDLSGFDKISTVGETNTEE